MNEEQEQVWNRLKHGMPSHFILAVVFHGNGTATKFNSGWLSDYQDRYMAIRIAVDDVAQSPYRDYKIEVNDIIFNKPPGPGLKITVEIYDQ